ncbi:MAG: hypothetical protein HOD63_05000 [Bacteroidetes bacterium]|jgi:hypothetical protein|nr:hypothetical protein [Bacteroidota bacterium]MBT5530374.1 hypothetical protein [Cytophagia bacterium]MBT3424457.1 hypothetical protein [Bacteroidota bacterium]MBT3801894.1 hypothetical protein [Bacteroidota bacterium]MBT3935093.1 hypothetical protein [Bacteroidota bacterium]
MKYFIYIILIFIAFSSCKRVKEKAKNAINESGEIVGKTAGEFGKGISEGVEETFKIDLELSDQLVAKGLESGKISLANDSIGTDNILVVYLISNQDFEQTIHAKVFDQDGLEMGRSQIDVALQTGDAAYYEFVFAKRTNIDRSSKIMLE